MTTAQLTPQSDQTPAVVSVANELSGPQWVSRFLGSRETSALAPAFRTSLEAFKGAMVSAGMQVHPSSTYRPIERSYLMHWCWMIKNGTDPSTVVAMEGVNIEWVHPTLAASVSAAKQMVTAYDMDDLHTAPALHSLHNEREAIDMRITWHGAVNINDASGTAVHVDTTPRNGMNAQLKLVGASYGVKKYVGGASDKPHWSTTGH